MATLSEKVQALGAIANRVQQANDQVRRVLCRAQERLADPDLTDAERSRLLQVAVARYADAASGVRATVALYPDAGELGAWQPPAELLGGE